MAYKFVNQMDKATGVYIDDTNGNPVILKKGVKVFDTSSYGLSLTGEARGDIPRRGVSAWEKVSIKDNGKLLAGDGTDPIAATVAGDATATVSGTNLNFVVDNLTFGSDARGDLARRGVSGYERFSAKTAGTIVFGNDTDVVSGIMTNDGKIENDAGNAKFTATHDTQYILKIPSTSGVDTDAYHGGIVGCDQTADLTATEQGATSIKVWDNSAVTAVEASATECKVYDVRKDVAATATHCKVFDIEYTVAASATWCKVYDDSAAAYEELETASADDFVQWQLFPNNTQDDDAVYFGASAPFDGITLDLSATVATYDEDDQNNTIWEYYNGASWATLTVSDGTSTDATGGSSFMQDGSVTFTRPGDWANVSVDSVDQYWIRCRVTDATDITQLAITNASRHTLIFDNEYEDLETASARDFVQYALYPSNTQDGDIVYFGAAATFEEIGIDISATNQTYTDDALIWEYWNGATWSTLTVIDSTHDSVTDGSRSFKQDGTISFTAPGDWAAVSVDSVNIYWIRARVVTASNISQVGITNSVLHTIVTRALFANLEDASAGDFVQYALYPSNTGDGDAVYFGDAATFTEIMIDISATNQTCTGGALTWEYWNGAAWSALSVTDSTHDSVFDGTQSFKQDGYVSFTAPGDWAATTVDSVERYWIRARASTASNISQIGITNSHLHYTVTRGSFANIEDAGTGDFTQWALLPANTEDEDIVYIGLDEPQPEIYFDLSATVQTYTGDALTWEYWNGSAWSALTLVDYTDATAQDGLRSFGRDGTIIIVPPSDWAASTVDSVEKYWIRASAGTAANISQVGILNSHRHYVITPAVGLVVPHDCTITAATIYDEAGTPHSTTDIKLMVVNFDTPECTSELTFVQDKRTTRWSGLSLTVSAGDTISAIITQEDGTNEIGSATLVLDVTLA